MKMSLAFEADGSFVLDGRVLTLEELDTELPKVPRGTSIVVTFASVGRDRRSTFRQVVKWIYAAGLDVFVLDFSKAVAEVSPNKRPAG